MNILFFHDSGQWRISTPEDSMGYRLEQLTAIDNIVTDWLCIELLNQHDVLLLTATTPGWELGDVEENLVTAAECARIVSAGLNAMRIRHDFIMSGMRPDVGAWMVEERTDLVVER